jgi:predicted dehydrogenase
MVKTGVIGVGHLGKEHARVLSKLPEASLIGVYDTDHTRANRVAEQYQCIAFDSAEDLLHSVDALIIASPTLTHYTYGKQAIVGGKHVFIEKPICSNLEDAQKLVKLSKKYATKVQVGHIERFNPAIIAIAKLLNNPLFIEANRIAPFTPRGTDVSVVIDLMIHDIDIILSLVKSPVKKVTAVGIPVLTSDIDIANAKIEFKNGAMANITASRIALKRERKIRFFQKTAYISIDYQDKSALVVRKKLELDAIMHEIMETSKTPELSQMYETEEVKIQEKEPLEAELENFINVIISNENPVVKAEDGYEALRIATLITADIEKHKKNIMV